MLCINNIFAQETENPIITRSAEEIKAEIEQVRQELHTATIKNSITQYSADRLTLEEKIAKESATLPIKNKLADLEYDLAIAEGRVIKLFDALEERSINYSVKGYNLEVGDILLIKPKPWKRMKFTVLWDWFQHAMLVIDNNRVIEAVWFWEDSRFRSLDDVFSVNEIKNYSEVMVLRVPKLTNDEKNRLVDYSKKNLYKRPYPKNTYDLYISKYAMDRFYCSSLVWRLYKSWVRFIDLDCDNSLVTWSEVVWPVDLISDKVIRYSLYY